MIVRPHPSLAPDDALVDREALALWCQRPARTIRQNCTPVACDTATRRSLYLYLDVQAMDANTQKRKRLAKAEAVMAA